MFNMTISIARWIVRMRMVILGVTEAMGGNRANIDSDLEKTSNAAALLIETLTVLPKSEVNFFW